MAVRGLSASRVLAGGLLIATASLAYLLLTAGAASADEPATGTITVVLDASPDDGQDFTFTGCKGEWCGPFVLDDDSDATRSTTTTAELEPGTYTVTQDAVANWTLSTLTCDTGETTSLANRRATIDLTAGEDVTCTFTNTSASITIIQSSYVADPHDFSYTGCLGSGCGSFALDDDDDPSLPDRTGGAGLAPGTYTVTQAADTDWALTSISCTTGETVNLVHRRVTITLTPGEQQTCTFSARPPSIAISSTTDPNDPQAFQFTGCLGSGCADFMLDRDPLTGPTASHRADVLAVGTYVITQAPNANWPLTDIDCDSAEAIDLVNRRVTITLTRGERQVCRFVNTSASLRLTEDTSPDGPEDFTFHRCLDTECTTVTLDDDAQEDRSNTTGEVALAPGTYTVTVDQTPGYELASITCTTGETLDLDNRQVIVTLSAGEQQSCTFTHRPPQPALAGVEQLSTNVLGSCARLSSGEARCWGTNSTEGRLGNGTFTDSPIPVVVANPEGTGPLTDVTDISAGFGHSCAVLSSSEARCWGYTNGGVGDGTTAIRTRPVVVSDETGSGPLTSVVQIAAGGNQTCALLESTQVRCWGQNTNGELGDGTTTTRTRPVAVSNPAGTGPLTGVTQISARLNHTCALLDSGEARCWGGNTEGQLGDGTTMNRSRPVVVSNPDGTGALTGITRIEAGFAETCALLSTGQARCWGDNTHGQLGDGTTTDRVRPVPVVDPEGSGPLTQISHLAPGGSACATRSDDSTLCWGLDMLTGTPRPLPSIVLNTAGDGPLTGVTAVTSGSDFNCALLVGGQARCWGHNAGRLGDGTWMPRSRPVPVIDPA